MDNKPRTMLRDNQPQTMPVKKEIPVLVKIIAVLYYIGAVLGIIFGLLFLIGAGMLSSLIEQIPLLIALGTSLFIVGGILMIGLGILGFFLGRGLWKGHNWARIVVIIFSILGLLGGISILVTGSYFNGIINILIEGFIAGYLLFSKGVKSAFSKPPLPQHPQL